MAYLIRFDPPETDAPIWAGWYKGAAGFAPTPKTAMRFDDAKTALRFLDNSYGGLHPYGSVVPEAEALKDWSGHVPAKVNERFTTR